MPHLSSPGTSLWLISNGYAHMYRWCTYSRHNSNSTTPSVHLRSLLGEQNCSVLVQQWLYKQGGGKYSSTCIRGRSYKLVHDATHTLTGKRRNKPFKFLLILSQLHQEKAAQSKVEGGVTQIKADVQKRKVLRLLDWKYVWYARVNDPLMNGELTVWFSRINWTESNFTSFLALPYLQEFKANTVITGLHAHIRM